MQDIIVTFIAIITFSIVGYKFYKNLTRKPSKSSKCEGCSGCALKEKTDCTL